MPVESTITTSRYVYSVNDRRGLVRGNLVPDWGGAFALRLGQSIYALHDGTTFDRNGPVIKIRNPVTGGMIHADINDPQSTILKALFMGYNGFSSHVIIIRDIQGRLSTNGMYLEDCYSWLAGDPTPSPHPQSDPVYSQPVAEAMRLLLEREAERQRAAAIERQRMYSAMATSAHSAASVNPVFRFDYQMTREPQRRDERNPNPKPPPRNKDWEWENE